MPRVCLAFLALLGLAAAPASAAIEGGPQDATVIAVVDSSFNPYHWDFLASKMPQAGNDVAGDELPLDRPAGEWLPGFVEPAGFERFDITLEPTNAKRSMDALRNADAKRWPEFRYNRPDAPRSYWIPGTKIITALDFSTSGSFLGNNAAHGFGTSSAAAGNLHGTCPECLLVLVRYSGIESGERAIQWAMDQPWIDVVTNSYGFGEYSRLTGRGDIRDNTYDDADVGKQRTASERGQAVFFSAGNGYENAFLAPNLTTFSSQKGPDWIYTVGAVSPPEDGHYPAFVEQYDERAGGYGGAGKVVDVASLGSDYPTGYESTSVGGTGTFGFSGTSNATPVVAGVYARSLLIARTLLAGPSRAQSADVVAVGGEPFACGTERPDCELGDGRLTATELRTRLLHGAVPTGNGLTISGQLLNPTLPKVGEETLLAEGHGTYLGRVRKGSAGWEEEQARVTGPLTGAAKALTRPAGEREWMVVDSYCRQKNWGSWTGGYFRDAATTPLPGPDPAWPVRSMLERTCPGGPHG